MCSADLAARILPPMLGADRVKRYFVGFRNEAEARGHRRVAGELRILQIDQASRSSPGFELDTKLNRVVSDVQLGSDYDHLYAAGESTDLCVSSN